MAQLSKDLQRYFFEDVPEDTLTLSDVLELAGARSFRFLFSLLALPSGAASTCRRLFDSVRLSHAFIGGTVYA